MITIPLRWVYYIPRYLLAVVTWCLVLSRVLNIPVSPLPKTQLLSDLVAGGFPYPSSLDLPTERGCGLRWAFTAYQLETSPFAPRAQMRQHFQAERLAPSSTGAGAIRTAIMKQALLQMTSPHGLRREVVSPDGNPRRTNILTTRKQNSEDPHSAGAFKCTFGAAVRLVCYASTDRGRGR